MLRSKGCLRQPRKLMMMMRFEVIFGGGVQIHLISQRLSINQRLFNQIFFFYLNIV